MKCAHKKPHIFRAPSLTQITLRNDFCGVFRLFKMYKTIFFSFWFIFLFVCVCVSYSFIHSFFLILILTIRSKLPFQSKGIRLFMCDTWNLNDVLFCFELHGKPEGSIPKNKDGFEIINTSIACFVWVKCWTQMCIYRNETEKGS